MSIIVSGGIEISGLMRANVTVPDIMPYHCINVKGTSQPLNGTLIIGDIVRGEGFGLSSTSPLDTGVTVYFDVFEPAGAKSKWESAPAVANVAQPFVPSNE